MAHAFAAQLRPHAPVKPATPYRYIEHPFDAKHGIDTGGFISAKHLVTGHPHDVYVTGFSAIAPSVFRDLCRRWVATLPDIAGRIEAFSFVDVGAGKGRAVLLASELPFRKVIGVELSSELAQSAYQNIERWKTLRRAVTSIRVVHQDITEFRWPRTPLLVYLFNPFELPLIEELVADLQTAALSGSGPIDVAYVNPVYSDAFRRHFRHLWTARIYMDKTDLAADPYATASDLVSAFRLTPP